MKKSLFIAILLTIAAVLPCLAQGEPKISVFAASIPRIAKVEGISNAEAAAKLYEMGYRGIEAWYDQEADVLKAAEKAGFKYACVLAKLDYTKGEQKEAEDAILKFAKKHKCNIVHVVLGFLDESLPDGGFKDISLRLKAFTERAAKQGVQILVEDYDNANSPTATSKRLDLMFANVPGLKMVFDTGNFLYSGEDMHMMVKRYSPLVRHVHLKDRTSETDMSLPAFGKGCLRMITAAKFFAQNGYDGWYTVEDDFTKEGLKAAKEDFEYVYKEIKDPSIDSPKYTEYFISRPKVVDPGKYARTGVPDDAIVLFDGTSLDEWTWKKKAEGIDGWAINEDGSMTVNEETGSLHTIRKFKDFQLHLEWRVPENITTTGQGRGNSGVHLLGPYEIQVLESYDNGTYSDGIAGSFYKQHTPLANPCRKPGEWNVYDVYFTAAKFNSFGELISNARATVIFNGVLIQNNVELYGTTQYVGFPQETETTEGAISLQAHGRFEYPVSYQNIWIREL